MSHTSHGTITISDLTDITDVYLQYGLALANATVTNSYSFNGTGEVGWSTTYPTWQSGYQIWIRQVTEKEGLPNEYGTPYLDTAVNQLNTTISAANANIVALQTKTKKIWTNLNNSTTYPAGTYAASGINNGEVTENNSSTYGYNTFLTHNKLALRYNAIDMAALTTNVLTFYTPTQDSNNNWIQGEKGIELSTDGLILYNPVASTPNNKGLELNNNGLYLYKPLVDGEASQSTAAQLTATGLNITEGSIELANGTNDSIKISNSNFTRSINSISHDDLRMAIGDKFGVASNGTLYASNVNIKGIIKATSGFIGQNETNGFTISNSAIYNPSTKTTLSSDTIDGIYLGKDGIALGQGTFKVTSAGALTAKSGTIGGITIGETYLTTNSSRTTYDATTAGLTITTSGIGAGNGTANTFKVDALTGALTAKSGTIGGWSFTDAALYYSNATPGYSTTNLVISKNSAVNTNAIAGSGTNKHWFLAAGRNFGVDTGGILYANGAKIKGEIQADTGYIDSSITIGSGGTSLSTIESNVSTALAGSIEYIMGTHGSTATNAWTGVTRDSSLVTGKTIAFYMTSAGTSTAATLNLTLASGVTTGAINIRINNSNVTTHYPQYSVVKMTYDGEYWKVDNYNSDTYNRTRYQAVLTAAEAITAAHIICGNTSGYRNIAANVAFDMTYPLLYAGTTIAKGATDGTRDNNYLEINNIAYTSNGTVTSGAAAKTIFLKGTITGNTFTIAASPFMTTVVPTSEDGYCYIPLGIMTSTTNGYFKSSSELWAYKDGAFGPVSIREASAAAKTATNYIAYISADDGIKVHNYGDTTDYVQVNSTKIAMYRNSVEKMQLTDSLLRLGDVSNYAKINADGMEVYNGGTSVARFGESVRLGTNDRLELSENKIMMVSGRSTPFVVENPENGTATTRTMNVTTDSYGSYYDLPASITEVKILAGTVGNPSGTMVTMTIPVVTDSSGSKSTTVTNNGVKFTLTNYNMFPGWGTGSYLLTITNTTSSTRYAKVTYTYIENGVRVVVNDAKLNVASSKTTIFDLITGKTKSYSLITYGHVAVLNMQVQTTATTAAGANVYEGILYSMKPVGGCRLSGYYGGTPVLGGITDTGDIVIRNCGSSSLSVTGNNFISVGGTFIFDDTSW